MNLSDKSFTTPEPEKKKEPLTAQEQLYRAAHLASIGTLASGVAHEINNPLTAILGFSSALLSRINNHEEIDRNELGTYLQIIHNETIRCRDIVEYFHRFAREHGEVRIGRVSLSESIVNALRLVNMRAMRSEVTILNEIEEDCWVRTDADRLEQVFINLLTSCIDFCGHGNTVVISAAAGKNKSNYAVVTVRDNGPGMTAEAAAGVFDLFFAAGEKGKVTVMALAVSRTIMEELGGRIDCVSEVGKGTTVSIDIPCDSPPAAPGAHE
jgi:two-component system, NtrC family, sensor kinase